MPFIAAAQIQRWGALLSAYQYEIEYKNSKAHANADCLSRLPTKEGTQLAMEDPVTVFQVSHVDELPLTARYIVYSPPAKIQYW